MHIVWKMLHGTLVFLGDAENFKLKLASYEHTENNIESLTGNAVEKVEEWIRSIR